ncbi:hypothetical protein A2348_05365 [Candidatus Uhrbacteria bacterium RIFOXYB12_FULL_58_10]|uniref:Uncharacterized protein n=1 Tax=Candidatus Uhrbacteria bacterium RIFOXYB2_FULL_57_15 TaxID=1802422 RepID=A0A1F7W7Y5_9BACT|nr:MAG: hypothetical protein A2348_05365 [Candidatus Uhrbacteria bacterium RIFOXYB12_FULL_58_10]OGL98911.1 MAG: hypothetical protein A2304_04130 [Candidatus Uhrbacteria bacterium RIFOXYB2_FULL_57_15]
MRRWNVEEVKELVERRDRLEADLAGVVRELQRACPHVDAQWLGQREEVQPDDSRFMVHAFLCPLCKKQWTQRNVRP